MVHRRRRESIRESVAFGAMIGTFGKDVALPASGNSQAPETVEFLALCDVPAASASVPESASDVPMESQQTHQACEGICCKRC